VLKLLLATLVTVAASVLLLGCVLVAHIFFAAPTSNSITAEVRVEPGDSLAAVARKLRDQKVILNEKVFSFWARLAGVEKKIHRGLYRFDSSLSAREILDRMVMGKAVFQSITIPEGLTIKEIAELLGKMQIADREKFLTQASDPELLVSLGHEAKGLEGYLFPDTYHFTPATPEKDILLAMAERFRKAIQPLMAELSDGDRLSPHDIVTLASVVEKETGVEAERPLVAAVFRNRLKRQMPLQSDPTVIYGLKNFDGNLTRRDLRDPSPFNTYRTTGLPPGPICNPGLSSIQAALHPADVPYLYFVSKNDGTHLFSESLEEHNRAVKTYQPVRESNPLRRKNLARR
jgi:peptidoglycan lytic transglycosylase G